MPVPLPARTHRSRRGYFMQKIVSVAGEYFFAHEQGISDALVQGQPDAADHAPEARGPYLPVAVDRILTDSGLPCQRLVHGEDQPHEECRFTLVTDRAWMALMRRFLCRKTHSWGRFGCGRKESGIVCAIDATNIVL